MSGFSAQWLSLREPVDHRSRNDVVRDAATGLFDGRGDASIVDLGCGAGSNLRALAPHLPRIQSWRLVDHDPALLTVARAALSAWAPPTDRLAERDCGCRCGEQLTDWDASAPSAVGAARNAPEESTRDTEPTLPDHWDAAEVAAE